MVADACSGDCRSPQVHWGSSGGINDDNNEFPSGLVVQREIEKNTLSVKLL